MIDIPGNMRKRGVYLWSGGIGVFGPFIELEWISQKGFHYSAGYSAWIIMPYGGIDEFLTDAVQNLLYRLGSWKKEKGIDE